MAVRLLAELPAGALEALLEPWGLTIAWVAPGAPIPGSFWGEPEAGIRGTTLFVRADTPVQSALHEGCHLLCADAIRRTGIDTDSGGTDLEEDAVCYLQIVLAGELPGLGRERMFSDMDEWGYSFRLGSARAWFEADAEDARAWLVAEGLLDAAGEPSGRARG
ncbi:MAG: hypothetical protein SF066_05205 [Thermoanaerobaculia bacterium]|nr:hypothetical protein [Thermoanaerobaculia bacterium]